VHLRNCRQLIEKGCSAWTIAKVVDAEPEIGMGLLGISVVLFMMGFVFLFDRTLLILGNVMANDLSSASLADCTS
jgi:hypothetical protein